MKKAAALSLAATAQLVVVLTAAGAPAPYFPYQTIEKYYNAPLNEPPAPAPPAAAPPPAPPEAKRPQPPPRPLQLPGQPPPIKGAPEFLFPAKLGFGVAVGVPYDLVYLDKTYYYWSNGIWHRSSSYRGPWTRVGYAELPAELRKQPLSMIRAQRNAEFESYFKNRDSYSGRLFSPDQEGK
ncbi:hypothetical protein GMST_40250 [Geomonas silvestris]|uniref:Lipoprotein n=1 Tax=Geomonas silvestris TaxID=2740184 RepID=A0A6V8MNV9_9BACT|nr:hypothetical protein [Geomonas silvestris]GFO61700.1 hypothetical protein GMST_40250 [Geomonas silvestris]